MVVKTLNKKSVALFGLCLFDSDSVNTLINERAIPHHMDPQIGPTQQVTTTQGTYNSSNYFLGETISFPDFCKTRFLQQVILRNFNSRTSGYDFIVGSDVLQKGFILNHAQHCVIWDGISIPMSVDARTNSTTATPTTHFLCELQLTEAYTVGMFKIKTAKYEKVDPSTVANQCHHLSSFQKNQSSTLDSKYPKLFSGELGRYNKSQFTLELQDPASTPIFCKPYPVPQAHVKVFKTEFNRLVNKGVLVPVPRSEWAFPTFIIPKKDGRVRWISDFRKLNKLLKRPRYFLPNIPQIMQRY